MRLELGAQSIDVISLSCYTETAVQPGHGSLIRTRTSDRVSVGDHSEPERENIWTSFVFKLTATSAGAVISVD